MLVATLLRASLYAGVAAAAAANGDDPLAKCPGYTASNVVRSSTGLTADLALAGPACNVYGDDLAHLTLAVTYETSKAPYVHQCADCSALTHAA